MSDTPRTEAECHACDTENGYDFGSSFDRMAAFARKLERELAHELAEKRRLAGVLRGYEAVLNNDLSKPDLMRFMENFYKRGGSQC